VWAVGLTLDSSLTANFPINPRTPLGVVLINSNCDTHTPINFLLLLEKLIKPQCHTALFIRSIVLNTLATIIFARSNRKYLNAFLLFAYRLL
jgi:hypothetical protein|tara:strand:- start:302 stop:577 length:276 start_codon:yes stop_codon:yes gene_type:complete